MAERERERERERESRMLLETRGNSQRQGKMSKLNRQAYGRDSSRRAVARKQSAERRWKRGREGQKGRLFQICTSETTSEINRASSLAGQPPRRPNDLYAKFHLRALTFRRPQRVIHVFPFFFLFLFFFFFFYFSFFFFFFFVVRRISRAPSLGSSGLAECKEIKRIALRLKYHRRIGGQVSGKLLDSEMNFHWFLLWNYSSRDPFPVVSRSRREV